jgi:hypothetical protein
MPFSLKLLTENWCGTRAGIATPVRVPEFSYLPRDSGSMQRRPSRGQNGVLNHFCRSGDNSNVTNCLKVFFMGSPAMRGDPEPCAY